MCLTRKASLVLASLIIGVLASLPARAQTLGTSGGFSGSGFGGLSPTPSAYQKASWHDFTSLDAATDFQPAGRLAGRALGANPSLPRDASAFGVLGLSLLLIPGFTHSVFAGSTPVWNDDLRLWINGLGGGMPGRPEAGVVIFGSDTTLYALLANVGLGQFPGGELQPGLR